MDDFTIYRQQRNYSDKTIKTQNNSISRFKNWCIAQSINLEKITYNQVLQFIDSERQRGIANQSIINEINAIRVYFDYLQESGIIGQNVIKRVKIRQSGKKVTSEILTQEQLENVYQNFLTLPQWEQGKLHKRNTVILGLLVYQGVTSGEIAKLEAGHINLMEGKVYIPASRKSNARTLKLQANQILPFKNYIEKLNSGSCLFPTQKHSDMISTIVQQIKKQNPEIRDSRQIRSSVIMNWLKSNNIRQVQYMAGHKKIKSTEQYRNQDLTDLSKQLELFHPLK
ncbi:MAG: tyrosine-type recombinase/integrase [Bacteroidales bacterium]|jgi:integrase/recombinase XerD|nr:tyrosine-type recombinase/integrase [Bacteroidales bacterium]